MSLKEGISTSAKGVAPPFVTGSYISAAIIIAQQVTRPRWHCQLALVECVLLRVAETNIALLPGFSIVLEGADPPQPSIRYRALAVEAAVSAAGSRDAVRLQHLLLGIMGAD